MSTDRDLLGVSQSSGGVQALTERDFTFAEDLGKYRLLGALGSGGMADVFLAVADGPEGFRKLCVLKLLKEAMTQDEEFRAMFLDEARLAARLNHPHIVQTFEVGETHSRLMIAMEYIEGQPATRVRRRLAPEQFSLAAHIGILCDVLDALEYAHGLADFDGSKLGIVHRDVSPHNIIIGYDARAKLVDFGIAKSAAAMQETQAGVLKGKAGYMAPEQAMMRDLDGRADLFSVGVILWEAIAGRRLSDGMSSHDVLVRRIEGRDPKIAEVVPDIDPRLAAICDRAMARDPDHRYATAGELQVELESWLKDHGGEPSRKELSKVLREAFAKEREQLRGLVEHRMGDGAPTFTRTSVTFAPGSRTPPPPDTTTPPHKLPHSPSTISVVPPVRRRTVPGFVILGVAASVVVGIGGTIYAVQSSTPSRAVVTAAPSSDELGQPPARVEKTPEPSPSPPTVTPPLGGAAGQTGQPGSQPQPGNQPVRTGFVPPPPMGRGPTGIPAPRASSPAVAPITGTPTPPNVTGGTSVPPTKTPTRPLDEKDPYAQ